MRPEAAILPGTASDGLDTARLADGLRPLLRDVGEYSRVLLPAHRLRDYQLGPARAIAESITGRLGRQFAVVFSRQSGKDEMLAQLIAWLLTRYQNGGRHHRRGGADADAAGQHHAATGCSIGCSARR